MVKIKHIWKKAAALTAAALLNISACLAAVPYDQVLIGGIGPGSDVGYMKTVYGQPDTTNFDTATQATYTYGTSFVITSNPSDANTIFTVLTSGHNGLNTPQGVGVGMDEAVITEKYGPCERKGEVNGVTYYHYAMEPNPRLPNAFGGYSFGVSNGKIVSIWAGVVADDNGEAAAAESEASTQLPAAPSAADVSSTNVEAVTPVPVVAPVTPQEAKTMASHNEAEKAPSNSQTTTKVTTAEGTTVTIEKNEG